MLTVVNGCARVQWFWHLPRYEDVELSVNETLSLAWNVEYSVVQVEWSYILCFSYM